MTEEMKKAGRVKFGCLKHRDGEDFMPFEANIKFLSRQIKDFKVETKDTSDDAMAISPIKSEKDDPSANIPNDIPGLD